MFCLHTGSYDTNVHLVFICVHVSIYKHEYNYIYFYRFNLFAADYTLVSGWRFDHAKHITVHVVPP